MNWYHHSRFNDASTPPFESHFLRPPPCLPFSRKKYPLRVTLILLMWDRIIDFSILIKCNTWCELVLLQLTSSSSSWGWRGWGGEVKCGLFIWSRESTKKANINFIVFHASLHAMWKLRGGSGKIEKARSANNNFTGNIISVIVRLFTPPCQILTNKCKDNSQQRRNRKPHSHIKFQHLKEINWVRMEKKGWKKKYENV